MSRAQKFWGSTIGKKVVMAVTGIIGIGFLLAHVAGNMALFKGPAAINSYSHFLHGPANEILWVMRVVLIVALVLHVAAAYSLTHEDHAARPSHYVKKLEPQAATIASRSMRWGGVLVLVFIVFHILHMTTGTIRPTGRFVEGDVYANLVSGFQIWWVALFYIVSMFFLGLHLYHGAWGSARTLGFTGNSPYPRHRQLAAVIAFVIWLGFTIIPLAVIVGVVK